MHRDVLSFKMPYMDYLELTEHILEHSIADTLYLIPFLFVTYILMEWLEHRTGAKTQNLIRRAGVGGPAIGALLGVVPQCGFSAAAATLFSGRVITLGTLYAVFLSTSDEMLPIFLAENVPLTTIVAIMSTKVACGMLFGFLTDLVIRLTRRREDRFRIHKICSEANCGCGNDCEKCRENPELVYQHLDEVRKAGTDDPVRADASGSSTSSTHHFQGHIQGWAQILKSALIHTLKITLFIFLITIVINAVFEMAGESALESVLGGDSIGSILLSALVGLIPNCAASIIIAQLYIEGVLGAGAMMSGLLVSAGIGLLVLVRTNRDWRENLFIILGLYVMGVIVGAIIGFAHIVF